MIRVQITDAQREELEEVSRQAVGRVALRAQMVLLAGRGYRVPRIADRGSRRSTPAGRTWCGCGCGAIRRRGCAA